VEYFVYCRDNPGAGALLEELAEAHWSYMDRFADVMIARGPTLTRDRTTHTGSMHIVDLPDAGAARAFAFEEPYHVAGAYGEVLVRRWGNELGRTMWEFRGDAAGDPRFLLLGLGQPGVNAAARALGEEHRRYLADGGYEERIVLRGPLLSDDGRDWVGSLTLVELPDRAAVDDLVRGEPLVSAGLYASLEIHDWQFGGRP
jgi:hypothetical protein